MHPCTPLQAQQRKAEAEGVNKAAAEGDEAVEELVEVQLEVEQRWDPSSLEGQVVLSPRALRLRREEAKRPFMRKSQLQEVRLCLLLQSGMGGASLWPATLKPMPLHWTGCHCSPRATPPLHPPTSSPPAGVAGEAE